MRDGGTERLAQGRRASAFGIGCNGLLFALKLLTGLAAGSVAVVADGVNNLTDAASNAVALLGFRLAAKPADAEHPYGHGRYEYLAGLTVAALILAAGVELLAGGVRELAHPTPVAFSAPMAAVLALSALVKLGMMAFYRRTGRRIGSETLLASAADSRSDALTTAAVLAGMVMLVLRLSFPPLVMDAVQSTADMVGPISMFITGMLLGGMDLKRIFGYRRVWLVAALRLVALPLVSLAVLKYTPLYTLVPDGRTILLITLLAASAPAASTVTQMAQYYGRDAEYARRNTQF